MKDQVNSCMTNLEEAQRWLATADNHLNQFAAAVQAKGMDPTPYLYPEEPFWLPRVVLSYRRPTGCCC